MKNTTLYWILVSLWTLPMLLLGSAGAFVHYVLDLTKALPTYYIYTISPYSCGMSVLLIVLAQKFYHTLSHILAVLSLSLTIAILIGWIYLYTAVIKSQEGLIFIFIVALGFHLFITHITMSNLRNLRIKRGMQPLQFF